MTVVHLPRWRALRLSAVGVVAVAALTACGGGSGSTASAPAAAPTGSPSARGRFDPAQLQKVQECLSAAGISLPTPSRGFRTFNPSDRPTSRPTGRPTGSPTGNGRFGRMFTDPQVRAALQACGITLPTGRPTNDRSPSTGATG